METAIKWIQKGYAVRTVLRICSVASSTYYYRLKHPVRKCSGSTGRPIPGYSKNRDGQSVSDGRIKGYLRRLIQGEHASSGYRKLTTLLRRTYKLVINKKKVYRLCKELDILSPQRKIAHPVPRKLAKNRTVTGPNQLWQVDIKYGYITGKRSHFYVANIIDVFDRQLVGYYRGRSCSTQDVIRAIQKALLKRDIHQHTHTLVIRSDNGPQFTSRLFANFVEQMNVKHERIPNSSPNMNAYVESFHSILERECFQRNYFETYEEAFMEVDRFMEYYNNRRLHGSLRDVPPVEYLELIKSGQVQPQKIAL